jgi:hypothetical protein
MSWLDDLSNGPSFANSTPLLSPHSTIQLPVQQLPDLSFDSDLFADVLSPDVFERHLLQLLPPQLGQLPVPAVLAQFDREYQSRKNWSDQLARPDASGVLMTIRMVCARRTDDTLFLYPNGGSSVECSRMVGLVLAVPRAASATLPADTKLKCRRIKSPDDFLRLLPSFSTRLGCEDLTTALSLKALVLVYGTTDQWRDENAKSGGISISVVVGSSSASAVLCFPFQEDRQAPNRYRCRCASQPVPHESRRVASG